MEGSLLLHREVYHRGKGSQMQEKKNNAKLQIVFSGLGLALVFILELYAMINLPEQFIVIGLLGVVLLAVLYVLINAVMAFQAQKEVRREEQYDSIFKSEKASYLMLKKNFEELEGKLEVIEKLSKLPADEIIGTQKGIGKVIINRSRENAEAIINSNEIVLDEMKEIKSAIDSRNEALLDSCKSMNDDTVQQLLLKQQDLLLELKNMELHLSNAIMQSQKNVAPAPVVEEPTPAAPEVDLSDPNKQLSADEIAALFASMSDEVTDSAPQPAVEETSKAPEVDLSDPNRQLSPDEIAALFSSMSS